MAPILQIVPLLRLSNVLMTFARYGHLTTTNHRAVWIAALVSWGIAMFACLAEAAASRVGYGLLTVSPLKILREVTTLAVFVPCAVLCLREGPKLDYVWARRRMIGAVNQMFRTEG